MTVIQGFLLGLLQGVAEFLPISSSGHLIVIQNIFGLNCVPLLFDLFLHLATLLSVCIFFRKKIARLFLCFIRMFSHKNGRSEIVGNDNDILCNTQEQGQNTIFALIISTVITAIIGLVTDKYIPSLSLNFIFASFILTALILIISNMIQHTPSYIEISKEKVCKKKTISKGNAVIIGIMQGFATLPGISRSGSTIAAATFCNIDSKTSGDYSFLISIPAILGAFILELKDLSKMTSTISIIPLIVGCITSFIVGYLSLIFLMKVIRKGKLHWFSLYLIPLGMIGLIFF